MTTDYAPLSLKPLAQPARLADLAGPERVALDAPAESVMTDIASEKVVRFMQGHGLTRNEVTVADMMTPARELQAVSLAQVKGMRVGHVVATLKATGRQHIIVADGNRVCGVFSTQRIARQLGIDFGAFTVAGTFSEIETALAG